MKKSLKSLLAVLLICALVTAFMPMAFAADAPVLKFGDDGKFTVMQFADCQDGYPAKAEMKAFINEALDKVQPDLVVFSGDNVVSENAQSYDEILLPLVERGIPFTMCFGNHDDECDPTRTPEDLLAIYQSYAGCLAYDPAPELSGCATHNLPIYSADGSTIAFNIWMMDSGDYMTNSAGGGCYSCVRADQIAWYQQQSAALELETGALVPSLMFQHIIPAEIYEAAFIASPVEMGEATRRFEDGSIYSVVPDLSKLEGYIFEPPCPSQYNFGQWDAIAARGDVLALAVGHDHTNSFRINIDGVDLINAPGCTWSSYGSDLVRGARVYEIDQNNPRAYNSYVVRAADLAVEDGSQIPTAETSVTTYQFLLYLDKLLVALHGLLGQNVMPI